MKPVIDDVLHEECFLFLLIHPLHSSSMPYTLEGNLFDHHFHMQSGGKLGCIMVIHLAAIMHVTGS